MASSDDDESPHTPSDVPAGSAHDLPPDLAADVPDSPSAPDPAHPAPAPRGSDDDDLAGTEDVAQPAPVSPEPDDERWLQIVAELGDIDLLAPDAPTPRTPPPGPPGRDWDGTAQMEAAEREVDSQEHFVPPEPPPVLGGDPLLTAAWFAAGGMPVFWLVVLVAWRDAPATLVQASVGVFVLGVAVLFWRMPHRRDPDDDDNGAVV